MSKYVTTNKVLRLHWDGGLQAVPFSVKWPYVQVRSFRSTTDGMRNACYQARAVSYQALESWRSLMRMHGFDVDECVQQLEGSYVSEAIGTDQSTKVVDAIVDAMEKVGK